MKHRTILGTIALAVSGAFGPANVAAQSPSAIAGTYRLTEIEGRRLPALVEGADTCREELISAWLVLHENGRWILTSMERDTCAGQGDLDDDKEMGRYTVSGSTVTFLEEDGDPPSDRTGGLVHDEKMDIEDLATATVSANVLTVRLHDGAVAVFKK
jgi:hypothetical protein